jgi:hypothetical protein
LNAQVDGWRLTPALTALGKLATAMARPSCRILTTNFDPLLAIAVRKAGGRAIAMALASDGNPMSADQDDAVLITQLHGDWYRADSLHTPSVLSADRPQLRAALRGIMADRLIVAFGYAGWDDVLTRAVADLMHESNARFDLRWAFREADSTEIETKYAALLQRVAQKRGTRVFMHTGVDANDFLPALARQFDAAGPSGGPTARREAPPTFQGDGSKPGKPRVYVSYSWRTKDLKKRAFDLAERLRSAGVDARLDLYYAESHHGFLPPEKRANDARPPWMIWQEEQIVEADRVLLICTKEYFESVEYPDDPSGKRSGAWHDVHFMIENLNSGRVGYNKFIPVGLGRYSEQSHFVPRFLEGSTYYDLDAGPGEGFGFDDLLRRFRTEFPRG